MTISFATPQLLLAAPQAASGYVTPGSVYNSNGRWASTTQLNASTVLSNLFPTLTGPQNAGQQVDYQALFVFNTDTEQTMANVFAWLPTSGLVTSAIDWAVGADSTGASTSTQTGTPQAGYITSPTIAPATVPAWYAPSGTPSGGASMASIPPGCVAALWIRRTATDYVTASVTAGFEIQVTYDVS
jgi:hypothetical protein